MMFRHLTIILFLLAAVTTATPFYAQPVPEDSMQVLHLDQTTTTGSLPSDTASHTRKPGLIKRFINAFNATDTTYIIPNKYNWAFMMQSTNSFEFFSLSSDEYDQRITFSPRPATKIGPYLGWRWIFLGYTFDVSSFGKNQRSQKTEFELSLYSSMLGCDLIYRNTGNDFRLRKVKGLGDEAETREGTLCNGINVRMKGINAYYIFNHKRFSYPAAFAQSTVQRKSCGTWKLGCSITQHTIDFDYNAIVQQINPSGNNSLNAEFKIDKIKYTDYSITFGYAYNWVFKPQWLFCISLTPAIGYKTASTDMLKNEEENSGQFLPGFDIENFNFDATLRTALVWNNTRYFGGLSLILHTYNYMHNKLNISNTFGTLNIYLGLNFHKRKQYRP